jgi:hypothetical protein
MNMKARIRIKFKRGIDEHMGPRKVSNMFNSANQQNPKMNNESERKDQATLESTWKKANGTTGNSK